MAAALGDIYRTTRPPVLMANKVSIEVFMVLYMVKSSFAGIKN
jgi:hypothetical protein